MYQLAHVSETTSALMIITPFCKVQ